MNEKRTARFSNGFFEKYYVNEQGKKDGLYCAYDNCGKLFMKRTYKNDVIDGPFETYCSDGTLMCRGTYKNGKIDGVYERYFKNLKVMGAYVNGAFIEGEKAFQKALTAQQQAALLEEKKELLIQKRDVFRAQNQADKESENMPAQNCSALVKMKKRLCQSGVEK